MVRSGKRAMGSKSRAVTGSGPTAPAGRGSKRRGIQSADKAVEVLIALVEAGQAAQLRDLANQARMPTSLVHRYLASLIASGLAVQSDVTGLYDLGPAAIRIGASALARVDPLRLGAEAMPHLVSATGLTALLNVLGDRGPTIVRWERSYVPFVTTLAVGSVLPLTGSASGRTILAFTPDRIQRELIASPHSDAGDTGINLAERFAQIRKQGYDTADSTVVPGLSAISAPILNLQNEAVASLTLIGSRTDIARAGVKAINRLCETARAVSRSCGSNLSFK